MKLKIKSNTLKGLLLHVGIVIALLLLLSFALFYKILPVLTNKGNIVTVPDLQGMTLTEAIDFLETKNLGYEVTDSSFNLDLPATTVLEQYPKPLARVKINRKINLKVNVKKPPTVKYPDLNGSTFELAQNQLKMLDLRPGTIKYRPDIAHNSILESSVNGVKIHAGQLISKGTKIDLTIGGATDIFALPDFTNMSVDEAEAYILDMALKIKKVHAEIDHTKESNIVQRQQPNPGDTVRHGDSVELWVINYKKDK
jgi:beta-lactam-binding protein with PASTA domain